MKVGIIMGSKSDLDTMKKASAVLDEFNIPYETFTVKECGNKLAFPMKWLLPQLIVPQRL